MSQIDFQPRIEAHHGVTIRDPYAILEEKTPEVGSWIENQNAATEAWLSNHAYPLL